MARIFLDANILFSATKTDGAIRDLLRRFLKAGHQCVADGYVWEEARRNLAIHCPGAIADLHELVTIIELNTSFAADSTITESLPLPGKDQPVLGAAIGLRCDVLLTGDRTHFGRLYGREFHGTTICSPLMAADTLLQ